MMKIGIIGGGSIGLLISSYLCVEHEVTIYVRRVEQKQKINDHGLYLSGNLTPFPVKALLLDEIKKEDYIIICVKQSQVSTILTKINKDDQEDRKSTRLNSSHVSISYAVFCLKKKNELKR